MFDDDDEGRPAAPTRGADARRSRRPDVPLPPRPGTARRGGQDGRSGRCERGSPDDRGARGFGGERVGPCDGAGDADTRADGADATGARALLEGLAGVHADEERRGGEPRTRPRLSVEPVHALVVMAILVVMLAASLALLVQQSVNLAAAGRSPPRRPGHRSLIGHRSRAGHRTVTCPRIFSSVLGPMPSMLSSSSTAPNRPTPAR